MMQLKEVWKSFLRLWDYSEAIISKWRKPGTVESLQRIEWPSKIPPRADQQLIKEVKRTHVNI